jgi:predicted transposase YdaD
VGPKAGKNYYILHYSENIQCELYKRAIIYFLDKKIMNTDQQVLYSLYSQEGRQALKPDIELQIYAPGNYSGDPWL